MVVFLPLANVVYQFVATKIDDYSIRHPARWSTWGAIACTSTARDKEEQHRPS